MGAFASGAWLKGLAWLCASGVLALNVVLIAMQTGEWAEAASEAGWNPLWVHGTLIPLSVALALFLGWVTVYPIWVRRPQLGHGLQTMPQPGVQAPALATTPYRRIGVAVELTGGDDVVLSRAAELARTNGAPLILVHVVEGPGAAYYGPATDDQESRTDRARMAELVGYLRREGLSAEGVLGFGNPPEELVRIAKEQGMDLLVLGTHGHRFLADLALGQTVSPVLHRLAIPVLVVPTTARRDST
jgi:manganese transport protein